MSAPIFVATADSGANRIQLTTVTATLPVGTVAGDGVLTYMDSANGARVISTPPAGWNYDSNARWGSVGYRRVFAWKIMTAADISAGSHDWVWDAQITGVWRSITFNNVDPDNFFTIAISDLSTESDGSNISGTCPTVTSVVDNSIILRQWDVHGWFVTDTGTITTLSGHTMRHWEVVDNGFTYSRQENDTVQVTAGATGTQAVAGTGFNNSGSSPDFRSSAATIAIGGAPEVVAGSAGEYRTFESFRGYRGH